MTTDRPGLTKIRRPCTRRVIPATGITHSVTDNLHLDAGVNFSVTEASDRVNPFADVSRRV
jgi:hypothetical protein